MSLSILDNVARNLPPLSIARALQAEASRAGFDWPDSRSMLAKVREELDELSEAIATGDQTGIGDEIGDLLLVIVNVARREGLEAEQCLTGACQKFEKRFREMEAVLASDGKRLEDQSLDTLDTLWRAAKNTTSAS